MKLIRIDTQKLLLSVIASAFSLLIALAVWVVVTVNQSQVEIARLQVMIIELQKDIRRFDQLEQRLLKLEKED